MTDSTSILLPTQEALLERLLYVASYSPQLRVLSGTKGVGKSTLVTALVSELEEYNSALVICPMHVSAAEIRRKILIQLLADPLFDDEVPLTETLLRLAADFSRPIHIAIDDAHFMPLELWAECLLLSEIRCGGRPISVTLTSEPDMLESLSSSLAPEQRELILQISIESLPMAEREALYFTLMSRSDSLPYVPREIVKAQLEKQSGSPADVVNLLRKALEPETAAIKAHKPLWWVVAAAVVMLTVAIGWFWPADKPATQWPTLTGEAIPWGEKLLQGYFAERQQKVEDEQELVSHEQTEAERAEPQEDNIVAVADAVEDEQGMASELLADAQAVAQVQTGELPEVENGTPVVELIPSSPPQETEQVAQTQEEQEVGMPPVFPVEGFTLQLATVSKRSSIPRVLKMLPKDVSPILARYRQQIVILVGQYDSMEQARQEAEALSRHNPKLSPWIRNWRHLAQYQPLGEEAQ
ncbi:ATP-binding protein [Shewanella sedimentimangrovi]|uniref:ATP-binding protein n=1 Tax=Shewanella sedimentimangrovi TaxID=2814293 RepID=A0ABX7QZQ1_9GAMM|nr:ATP-binding protein [Shewanella sedimentimangrovi]QSX37034.1 ATP-binding protein [Shewanella sedimentimangrovi]